MRRVAAVKSRLPKTRYPHMKPRVHEEVPWWWHKGEDAGDEDDNTSRPSERRVDAKVDATRPSNETFLGTHKG